MFAFKPTRMNRMLLPLFFRSFISIDPYYYVCTKLLLRFSRAATLLTCSSVLNSSYIFYVCKTSYYFICTKLLLHFFKLLLSHIPFFQNSKVSYFLSGKLQTSSFLKKIINSSLFRNFNPSLH